MRHRKLPLGAVLLLLLACLKARCSLARANEEDQISCRVHVVNNTDSPANAGGASRSSSVRVLSAADIADVSVVLQLQHPNVASLEVALTAVGVTKASTKVLLKAAAGAAGASGGANMVQTIFSDYAPAAFPLTPADAPFSSVYRPAEPLARLVAGNGTAAGAGGSEGVWTLSVRDTAAGDSRPMKLTGWELWLCGAADGPLFAPNAANATAFDSEDVTAEVSIVKKKVTFPAKADVSAVIKSNRRMSQSDNNIGAQIIDQLNTYLAKAIASKFDDVTPLLERASPKLAAALNSSIADSISTLRGMPGALGYVQAADGGWSLPTSEEAIKEFLDTLVRCYSDLYWCWQETGLGGNFAQDFVASWESAARPVAEGWANTQQQWVSAIANFEESNPALSRWGDVLFYSTIGNLYCAAQLDAIASVGQTWAETAIRLALYLSPLRFAINPRAFVVQAASLAVVPLRTVFNAFNYLTDLTDEDNNNDVAAITAFANGLVGAGREVFDLATLGIRTRAEGIQRRIETSAGSLANSAADLNEQMAGVLGSIDPRLGAMLNASTEGINNMLREVAASQQDTVEAYFRQQANRRTLASKFDETMQLAGGVVVQMATNTAAAVKAAQGALDDAVPGPSVQRVLINLRNTTEGILSDAQAALGRVMPTPEIQEMDALMRATVQSVLALMEDSANEVTDGPGVLAIQEQLGRLATSLEGAQSRVSGAFVNISSAFPGPMFNSTLEGMRQQGARTITNVQRMFSGLAKDYPNLDATKFVSELGSSLASLAANTMDLTTAFDNLATSEQSRALSEAIPAAVKPVTEAVQRATKDLPKLLPMAAAEQPETLNKLQQEIEGMAQDFAASMQDVASSLPKQPALKAITDNLAGRSEDLGATGQALTEALRNAIGAPREVASAALDDFNGRLSGLLDDLESQNARGAELARQLAEGPLTNIAKGLEGVLGPVRAGVEALTSRLPQGDDVRRVVDTQILPPLEALGTTAREAAQVALRATAEANSGGLSVVAQNTQRLTSLLVEGQIQAANLLKAATSATEQLQGVADQAAGAAQPVVAALDPVLASVTKQVSDGFLGTMESLTQAVPPQVTEGLIRPVAKALNDRLGAVLKGVSSDNVANGLATVLDSAAGVVSGLMRDSSAVLTGRAPATSTGGRHLLQVAPLTNLPPTFDSKAFQRSLIKALGVAGSQFASATVAAVNGRPGASLIAGAVQELLKSITGAGGSFGKWLALLPSGKVLSIVLDPKGGRLIKNLLGLLTGLKSAAPDQQAALLKQTADVLASLGAGSPLTSARGALQQALQGANASVAAAPGQDLLAAFQARLQAAMDAAAANGN